MATTPVAIATLNLSPGATAQLLKYVNGEQVVEFAVIVRGADRQATYYGTFAPEHEERARQVFAGLVTSGLVMLP
jgi:hypothetical protein